MRVRNTMLMAGMVLIALLFVACMQPSDPAEEQLEAQEVHQPRIASWLAKKDEIIRSQKPYSLVMTGWFTPEEAREIRNHSPDVLLLAGLTTSWVYDTHEWMTFLTTVANHGKEEPVEVTEDMYLRDPSGDRCAFGWECETFGTSEIYAMDPRNAKWVELITSFYRNALAQPQHDGIIVDMVVERQWWCPEAISDEEWVEGNRAIMAEIRREAKSKLVVFNAGKDLSDIDAYVGYFDGYMMENFLGDQMRSTFTDGLRAADSGYIVIYAVDTDDTGEVDLRKMRLGLALSLLNDNTYFTYDFGPRDHGQAWWFPEYDVDLGKPVGSYYQKGDAFWREFENGIVICSPHSNTEVRLDRAMVDVTSGRVSTSFTIYAGDAMILSIAEDR